MLSDRLYSSHSIISYNTLAEEPVLHVHFSYKSLIPSSLIPSHCILILQLDAVAAGPALNGIDTPFLDLHDRRLTESVSAVVRVDGGAVAVRPVGVVEDAVRGLDGGGEGEAA